MKRITILLFCSILTLKVSSQKLQTNPYTNKYEVEAVAKFSNMTKNQLYDKTFEWLNTWKYDPSKKDIKRGFDIDTSNHQIIANIIFNPDKDNLYGGSMSNYWADMTNFRIGFILTLDFKDEKLRYNFTDFYYFSTANSKVIFESDNFKNRDTILRDRILQASEKYVYSSINELIIYIISFENSSTW